MRSITTLISLVVLTAISTAAARPPNIVILLADDLGYGELGCQGNPEIPTPHIDSIAAEGVRFTSGYVTGPNCSPSRAGMLSGRTPTRFGYEFNPIGARNEEPGVGIPKSEYLLSEFLHDTGYTTALIGKWHLGGTAPYHPIRRGHDTFFGFLHEGHFFVPPPYEGVTSMIRRKALPPGAEGSRWVSADGRFAYTSHMRHDEPAYDANNPIVRGGQPVVEESYLTDALTREAVGFIEANADKPFFLFLAYNAVHSPLQGADAYMGKFSHIEDLHRRIFAAMLANLDDSVGDVLGTLRERSLDEDTLVFFLSDNGGPTRELTSSNLPLRGEKSDMYEGGIRVPFLARWKGKIPEGLTFEKPVSSLDLYATSAAAAGQALPPKKEGVDLLPYLTGEDTGTPHERLYWRQGKRFALREGKWKIVKNQKGKKEIPWALFDIESDPSETKDLAGENPVKLAEMVGRWEVMNAEMAEPLF